MNCECEIESESVYIWHNSLTLRMSSCMYGILHMIWKSWIIFIPFAFNLLIIILVLLFFLKLFYF